MDDSKCYILHPMLQVTGTSLIHKDTGNIVSFTGNAGLRMALNLLKC